MPLPSPLESRDQPLFRSGAWRRNTIATSNVEEVGRRPAPTKVFWLIIILDPIRH